MTKAFGLLPLVVIATTMAAWWPFAFLSGMALLLMVLILLARSVMILQMAYRITTPFATILPRGCQTVRGVVEMALALNYVGMSRLEPGWSRHKVWEVLQALIVERMGVTHGQIKEPASFINDRGLD
jgi:hypothetical protein